MAGADYLTDNDDISVIFFGPITSLKVTPGQALAGTARSAPETEADLMTILCQVAPAGPPVETK